MKAMLLFLLTLSMVVMPFAVAQEKDKPADDANSNAPPKPLSDAMSTWMVGEWSGTSESSMGAAEEWQKNEMSLDNQFVVMNFTSHFTKVNPEYLKTMAASMKMSEQDAEKMMMGSTYKGMGLMTIHPKTGDYIGYWFDSWRGMYKGIGTLEGNKITMNWEGTMGSSVRTMEKDEKGQLIQTYKEKDMSGSVVEGKSVFTRKEK